jgi:AcrR family transcriptional regulator
MVSNSSVSPHNLVMQANLLKAATALLREFGPAAVTTRAVAAAAGVTAPTIYRFFGDKDGLLNAIAEHVLSTYVSEKSRISAELTTGESDPVVDLRSSWNAHIEFGLINPHVFTLLTDPDRADSPAALAGIQVLTDRVHRVAVSGQLRVSELRAVDLIHAAGTGVILTLIAKRPELRDLSLADSARDAVFQSILVDTAMPPMDSVAAAAVALRASAFDLSMLTEPERALLVEWLDRIIPWGVSS